MSDKETNKSSKSESVKTDSIDSAGAVTGESAKSVTIKEETKAQASKSVKAAVKKSSVKKSAVKTPVVKKTAEEIAKADEAIRSKKSIDELKQRAAAAKKRAQEKILEKAYVSDKPIDPLERLANTFHESARRWEMVVYPTLFAFVLLASYGFFLIYHLTHDISTLSQSVTRMAVIVSEAMPRMTKDMDTLTGSIDNMTDNITGMSGDIRGMTTEITSMSGQMNTLTPLSQNISNMTATMNEMNRSVYGMQRDMGGMNRTISSGPFGMMNDAMPFHSNTNVAPQLPPPTYRQPWEIRRPVATRRQSTNRVPATKPTLNKQQSANKHSTTENNRKSVQPLQQPVRQNQVIHKPALNGSGLKNHQVVATSKE